MCIEIGNVKTFSEDMAEISGFGLDSIEETNARGMVLAGVKWLDAHPDVEPEKLRFLTIALLGLIKPDSDEAQQLEDAVVAAYPDAPMPYLYVTMRHILRVKNVGWDKYVEESREVQKKRLAGDPEFVMPPVGERPQA